MAALLIAMSITAIMMTVAMPAWKQLVQREKEEELVFRGQQYIHAITLYGRKFANTQPPSIDVLVNQKFLRKKYKDPITNDDFQLVTATAQAPSNSAGRGGGTGAATPGGASGGAAGGSTSPGPRAATAPTTPTGSSSTGTIGGGPVGGIVGVTSKSKDKSIRLYNGRSHYNEWVFTYQPQQIPGGGTGAGVPGGSTGRGGTGGVGGVGGNGRGDGRGNRGSGANPPPNPRTPGSLFPGGAGGQTPRPGGGRF
jgi:type II secretory pathway pseudopilin PulG